MLLWQGLIPGGVIGNTEAFGAPILGSSPSRVVKKSTLKVKLEVKCRIE